MDQTQAIGEVLRMLRRRWAMIALVTFSGVLASILWAIEKPSLYETYAKILIESAQISDELARSTVNMTTAQRLQLIEERLLARDNLIAVIERLDLFADAPGLTMTEKIELVRDSVRIESISTSGQGQGWGGPQAGIFAFTIAVRLGDPDKAAEMVNQFVDSAIEQNLQVRAERARDTLAYFEQEEQRVGAAVGALEAEIGAFKRENEDALPESLEARRVELAQVQASALDLDRRILELQEKQAELAAGRPLRAADTIGPEETELRELELELAQKRRVLAPSHPEIRRLEAQIAAVSALVAPLSQGEDGEPGKPGEDQRKAIQRQIAQLATQATLLEGQKAELASRRTQLEDSIRRTPEVEIGLVALTRRLADQQDQYSDIIRRRAEARTGAELETTQRSERFQVVESALVPDHPVAPNRKKLVVFGSGASVALALGLAFLIEMLRPVLRSSAQVERQLDLRPVVSIPYVVAPGERWRRRGSLAVRFVLAAAAVAVALMLVDRYVSPLAPIGQKIADTVGLGGVETARSGS